ncbi:4354_t:CDS:1 [Funneliformis geosporum]|uniref:7446_t:CDS:1 n=1 Tax=Funneliformis geosporum TaxID=1117311 RepID=A0A9W4WLJ7_9GLOM|nr:7446_t:CDS:1 [Funneliformis geosporum]CAI2164007.1 4354_t:CDS:1 [Funneliformis geosporum]
MLTLVGGYGLSKLYGKYYTRELLDHEISDDGTEQALISSTSLSSTAYASSSSISEKIKLRGNSSKSKKYCIIIENLIIDITTKQNQAIRFRKKYHKNLNGILKSIDEMREIICVTEAENLKKIHKILDDIEKYHKYKDVNLPKNKSHIKELEKQLMQEEAYLDTELRVLQADLGMLMWKYEELDNYALKEWEYSQSEIQQLRARLMKEATRFSKLKESKYYY